MKRIIIALAAFSVFRPDVAQGQSGSTRFDAGVQIASSSSSQILEYVGRYTHRVAIANQRLLDMDDGHIRFRYTNYRTDPPQTPQTMTLEATEFIRRFLLHVLPCGFHRIRYYGWLGHRHRTETLARCRQLLGTTAAAVPPTTGETRPPSDYRDRYESLTGVSLRRCPLCADGHMIVTLSWLRGCAYPAAPPDTS